VRGDNNLILVGFEFQILTPWYLMHFCILFDRYRGIYNFIIEIFQISLYRYLASCRYSTGHRYRYSKICLRIYLPIF